MRTRGADRKRVRHGIVLSEPAVITPYGTPYRAVSTNRSIGIPCVFGVRPDRFDHQVEFIYRRR